MKQIGCLPTTDDPQARAIRSAKNKKHWTIKNPPEDVCRLVERAIREHGRDKKFWIIECLRAGLKKYAKKKDTLPESSSPIGL